MTPRAVALTLGALFALLTVVELLVGEWVVGGSTILDRTTKANLLHWMVALAMLGTYFAGGISSRVACRIVGGVFLGLTAWGLLSAVSLGEVLGYTDGIPPSYQALHALTAAAALMAGLRGSPGTP